MNVITGVSICAVLSAIAFKKEILNTTGVLASFFVGSLVAVLGGLEWLSVLLAFVIIGFYSTNIGYDKKKERGLLEGDHGERKMRNVLANGVIPIGIVVVYWFYRTVEPVSSSVLLLLTAGYVGSLSTAASDTLASEIGSLDMNARLITNFKRVQPGSDGGVSLLGEIAAVLGALVIGVVSFFLFPLENVVIIAFVTGILGCHVDSVLGATLERRNYLTNEEVNLIATSVGALIGGLLVLI